MRKKFLKWLCCPLNKNNNHSTVHSNDNLIEKPLLVKRISKTKYKDFLYKPECPYCGSKNISPLNDTFSYCCRCQKTFRCSSKDII